MAYEQIGSTGGSLNFNDIKHTLIYVVIFFVAISLGDVIANNLIDGLHNLNPSLEYIEHGIGASLSLILILLKKWLQDNEIFIKK